MQNNYPRFSKQKVMVFPPADPHLDLLKELRRGSLALEGKNGGSHGDSRLGIAIRFQGPKKGGTPKQHH